ncbi:uncharacterized protein LOC134820032 [Bolinopsis microptera]|uniref:uncharacterized protein LOC134820032 n=1 Tax=Bolinopsis microptera TaxID=2820187 RepID=UPI00307A1659
MIFFVLLIGAASAAAPGLLQSALSNPAVFTKLFSEYGVAQDRHYLAQERRLRAGLFRQTLKEVVEHNGVGDREDWVMELNMFADMTEEEKAGYTGFNASQAFESLGDVEEAVVPQYLSNPSSKDWRGVAVTKVKDQKSCGSCWIFSAFGALEGHYKTQGSILKSFSEQEGLNCIQWNGCNGGFMGDVFDWLKESNRVGAMKDLPYRGKPGSCSGNRHENALIAFRVTGYSNARGDSGHVTALATKGPLSVGYSVASDFFKYKGGVYRKSSCSGGGHAVTSVGYTADYFRMKNSWGARWGESGYFRIGRGNVCGITDMGFAPTFKSTGQTDNGTDEGGDDGGDDDNSGGYGGDCHEGFRKCPDGSCKHEHWDC